jgi:hypothetical protein
MTRSLIALTLVAATLTACASSGAYPASVVSHDRPSEAARAGFTAGVFEAPQAEPSRKVMRSANLSLEVDDIDASGREIVRLTTEAGGFVLSSSRNRYHVKVPASGLDSSLAQFEGLGEVTHRALTGEDVTAEYMDLGVRLKNAHAARDSYELLLKKAVNVEEMLKVEQALNEVQERIELLEGRRRFLDEHLALSDVTIGLSEHRQAGPLQVLWNVISWPFKKLWWL